jgi:hypothetical protein
MTESIRNAITLPHKYLTAQLEKLDFKQVTGSGWKREGEKFQFDIFHGNRIHTTKLLYSPLEEGRHSIMKEFSHLGRNKKTTSTV